MGVTNRLVFDPTDANSIAASSSIGAHVLSGTDGSQIGHETLNAVDWLRTAGPIIDSAGNEVGVTSNALDVNIAAATGLAIFAEDSAHTSGDDGQHIMLVRQDTLAASTSADGDYGSFKSDSLGRLYVTNDDLNATDDAVAAWAHDGSGTALTSTLIGSDQALDVNVVGGDIDDNLANTAVAFSATAVSTTAVNIVTSALSNRKWVYMANEGNKTLYIGSSTTTGFPMHPGQQIELRLGASVEPQIIGGTGASSEDLRVMELS